MCFQYQSSMGHDVLYDLVLCLSFLVVQVSWVQCSGYQVIPGQSGQGVALSIHSHLRLRLKRNRCIPFSPFCAFMAGYRGNFIICLTHEWAITKQNAFKKAMLFHNLMKVYWSCIILMLNTFLDWTHLCNSKRLSCFPVSDSKLKIQTYGKRNLNIFHSIPLI